jgi:hypothetical protein
MTRLDLTPRAASLHSLVAGLLLTALIGSLAVAKFANGETRSKYAQTRADMRAIGMAVENYRADWGVYPPSFPIGNSFSVSMLTDFLNRMTQPTQYLHYPVATDPFYPITAATSPLPYYKFINYEPIVENDWAWFAVYSHNTEASRSFLIWSYGPDRIDDNLYWGPTVSSPPSIVSTFCNLIYDPTNGTFSRGDIGFQGGEVLLKQLPIER